MVSLELLVKSMLDLRQPDTLGHKSSPIQSRDTRSTSNLHDSPVQVDERTRRRRAWLRSDWSSQSRSVLGAEEVPPFPEERADSADSATEPSSRGQSQDRGSESQDSACSLGYDSRESSLDRPLNDVDSLNAVSSDEEASGGERLRAVTVSSVEEALRAVTEDHGPGDFDKKDDEALAHNSTAERSPVPRRSMSSHFLNRAHNRRSAPVFGTAHGKEQDGPCPQPPVSKVRPLMGDGQDRSSQDDLSTSTRSLTSDSVVIPRAQKKTSKHVWRLSVPSTNASSLLDTSAGLHKSQSVQNLAYEAPASVSSSDRRPPLKRPQHLFLNQTKPSSRPSTSPHSPPSPRTSHSYMNPTASSKAKISRSMSVGEGLHGDTPPRSPSLTRASRDAAGAPFSASCPVAGPPLRASVTPSVVPASRIPLPKQQHTPRRSLVLECGPSRSPTPSRTDPASDAALAADKQASDRHQSLEPRAQSPLPLKQKTTCALGSAGENEREAVVKGRPPVDEEGSITSEGSQKGRITDESITVETCQQVVTELQDCLRRTIHCYTSVVDSGPDLTKDQQRMKSVLSTALLSVKTDLHSLPPHSPQQGGPQGGRAEGDSTSALLEQYALLLLQSVEKKLENKA